MELKPHVLYEEIITCSMLMSKGIYQVGTSLKMIKEGFLYQSTKGLGAVVSNDEASRLKIVDKEMIEKFTLAESQIKTGLGMMSEAQARTFAVLRSIAELGGPKEITAFFERAGGSQTEIQKMFSEARLITENFFDWFVKEAK